MEAEVGRHCHCQDCQGGHQGLDPRRGRTGRCGGAGDRQAAGLWNPRVYISTGHSRCSAEIGLLGSFWGPNQCPPAEPPKPPRRPNETKRWLHMDMFVSRDPDPPGPSRPSLWREGKGTRGKPKLARSTEIKAFRFGLRPGGRSARPLKNGLRGPPWAVWGPKSICLPCKTCTPLRCCIRGVQVLKGENIDFGPQAAQGGPRMDQPQWMESKFGWKPVGCKSKNQQPTPT